MRIAVLGNSGSGKSTFARTWSADRGLAALDLDTVAWVPGEIAVARDRGEACADVVAFCEQHPSWVIEGCYGFLIEPALVFQPLLILLDPGVEACLEHCRQRPWEPHKYASPEEQDQRLEMLLGWVREYETRDEDPSRSAHEALFAAYTGPKRRLASSADPIGL